MSDSVASSAFLLTDIARLLGANLVGGDCQIKGLATLEQAQSGQLSFFANPRYLEQLKATKASAVLVSADFSQFAPCAALVLDNPYLGYAKASALFDQTADISPGWGPGVSVAPSAVIDPSAQLSANVVVGEGSVVGENVFVGPNTVIGRGCRLDDGVRLNANVTLYDDIKIGQNSLIHSGAVLGADGFGFAPDGRRWEKIHQLGGVTIGQNVEVGAGTTIDRGALSDTVIEDGVKLDNQIQIAHNVIIGDSTAIAGCTAVAGSTKIGAHCTIAGGVGIAGHLEIAAGTHVTAMSLISKSIEKAGAYSSGTGQMPYKQWKRSVVRFRQLDDLAKRIKSLEEKIEKSEG